MVGVVGYGMHIPRWHRIKIEEVVRKASKLGWFGIAYLVGYGGAGVNFVSYMIAIEKVSIYCTSTGVIIPFHPSLEVDPIFRFGTEVQKQKYMLDMCSGRKVGCYALTEPGAGSDAGGTKTTAKLQGDQWVLNGNKQFITNGAEADVAVVFVFIDPEKMFFMFFGFIFFSLSPFLLCKGGFS